MEHLGTLFLNNCLQSLTTSSSSSMAGIPEEAEVGTRTVQIYTKLKSEAFGFSSDTAFPSKFQKNPLFISLYDPKVPKNKNQTTPRL